MPLGNCNFKHQRDTTTYPLEWPKSETLSNQLYQPYQILARMWHNRNSQSLLVGMQNGTTTWEDNLSISYKTKHILTIRFSKSTS